MRADTPMRRWFSASGAQRLRDASAVQYEDYLEIAMAPASCTEMDEDRAQIELDLERIASSVCEFILGVVLEDDAEPSMDAVAPHVPRLRNVLRAYSVRNPRVGYIQGHADVICFLLGVVHDEQETFWIYCALIERLFPEDFFARAPKLHGFHVDAALLAHLIADQLVPHVSPLAGVDLSLITSLLACKWFVPVWVGELPMSLLVQVWDAMLCSDDGTILHLLLALYFVRSAADALAVTLDGVSWDSSFVYKATLTSAREHESIDLSTILSQAKSIFSLNDERVEDMRAALRCQPQLRELEVKELCRICRFHPAELARLQDEFSFARTQLKHCQRQQLRGVRVEYVETLLARDFPALPPTAQHHFVEQMPPDGYGNVSFFNLMKLLSVLYRGTLEERARLVFAAAGHQSERGLNQREQEALADMLCGLVIHQVLQCASFPSGVPLDFEGHGRQHSQRSPLLFAHFRRSLGDMCDGEMLTREVWLREVSKSTDLSMLLMGWSMQGSAIQRLSRFFRKHRSKGKRLPLTSTSAELIRMSSARSSSSSAKTPRPVKSPWSPKTASSHQHVLTYAVAPPQSSDIEWAPISLLSKRMKKNYTKMNRSNAAIDGWNRVPAMCGVDGEALEFDGHLQAFLCQCVIS